MNGQQEQQTEPERTLRYDKRSYEKHREKRIKQMSEYNRRYYEKNRERLKLKRCQG